MFLENKWERGQERGWIEVITGSMFSGKTEELIRRLRRAQIAGLRTDVFKPVLDNRYSADNVVSHDQGVHPSTAVDSPSSILLLSGGLEVVGIDEAQFFDHSIIDVCNTLANNGVRVIVAGLDTDFRGKPFGPMPDLIASAEYVTKVHAICMRCGSLANFSYRKTSDTQLVLTGEKNIYEPLCRRCYNLLTKL
jgi:thymidine kinase